MLTRGEDRRGRAASPARTPLNQGRRYIPDGEQLDWSIIYEITARLAGVATDAAATLPVVAVLGFAAGRRRDGRFLFAANAALTRFCLALAIVPPVYYFLDYAAGLAPILRPENSFLAPLFAPAGFGWLAAILASLCAALCLWLASATLSRVSPSFQGDRYALADLRVPVILLLLASALYLASFWLVNWPFAGAPSELSGRRVFAAVTKNAARHFFASFSAGGALALLDAVYRSFPSGEARLLAMRWLAFWAAIGYLPYLLTATGLALGAAAGHVASFNFVAHALLQGSLIGALICWCLILFGKKTAKIIVIVGCSLLALRALAPVVLRLLRDASQY